MNESGYVLYARPDNGRGIYKQQGEFFDNRWVVPHSPELLRRFNCHINVERVFATQSIKYLYKYLSKGPDRAELNIDCSTVEHDEVHAALDGRYYYFKYS